MYAGEMTEIVRARIAGGAILVATLALPLAGAWAAGRNLASVFTFPPPLDIPTDYPRFSWWAAALVIAPFLALAMVWIRNHRAVPSPSGVPTGHSAPHRFPWWGWIAVGWTVGWWILAWNRFAWFAALQRYTFFPLWLGFVITVNAITAWRSGTCLMRRMPARWIGLFFASATFWWIFEWLNRFTRNWHYLGVSDFGAGSYAAHATVCFSTVLPAVAGVAEFLAQSTRGQNACAAGPPLRWIAAPWTGRVFLGIGVVGLIGAGALPARFYAAVWAAPLALLLGDGILARRKDVTGEIAVGDWRRSATWAVAALVCGGFWELWNVHSAAKWIYTVPFTDRWHIFEMPLLGYAGYLPFGLECYCVAARVFGTDAVLPFSRVSST